MGLNHEGVLMAGASKKEIEAAAHGAAAVVTQQGGVATALPPNDALALMEGIPESERVSATWAFRVRRDRVGKGGGGSIWSNAGDYPHVPGDSNFADSTKVELILKYGPGDYEGRAKDAGGKLIMSVSPWRFRVSREEALDVGWVDTYAQQQAAQTAQANAPREKDPVNEAKQRIELARLAAEEERARAELERSKAEAKRASEPDKKAASEEQTTAITKILDAEKRAARAEADVAAAEAKAAHARELAQLTAEKATLQQTIDRDREDFKRQLADLAKKIDERKVPDTNTAEVVMDKIGATLAPLSPLIQALAQRILNPPAPPPPPPVQQQPNMIETIKALRDVIQPPEKRNPIEEMKNLASAMKDTMEAMGGAGGKEEKTLIEQLEEYRTMKEVFGEEQSTLDKVGQVGEKILRTAGEVARPYLMRGRMVSPEGKGKKVKKVRPRTEGGEIAKNEAADVAASAEEKPTGPQPVTGLPNAQQWGELCASLTEAMDKKASPLNVARNLTRLYPTVAELIVTAGTPEMVDAGLVEAAGEVGQVHGRAVMSLASKLRSDPGKTWAKEMIAELTKLSQKTQ